MRKERKKWSIDRIALYQIVIIIHIGLSERKDKKWSNDRIALSQRANQSEVVSVMNKQGIRLEIMDKHCSSQYPIFLFGFVSDTFCQTKKHKHIINK